MNDSAHTFCQRLGLAHPIIQAPMAGVATPALAAAVSSIGALGSLGLGASSPGQARQMIDEAQALGARPLNLNVFCHRQPQRDGEHERAWLARLAPLFARFATTPPTELNEIYPAFGDDETMQALLLEARPAVVSFHFGLPDAAYLARLKDAGIFTMASATSLAEAQAIEAAGLDAIIAQGIEAGGHRGIFDPDGSDEQLPTSVLLRQLLARTRLPVVAAGGIMDGHAIRAALTQGAAAVQLGTAFILCPESAANAAYRARLIGAAADPAPITRLTRTLSGRPARALLNDFIRQTDTADGALPAAYPLAYDALKQLAAAAASQDDHQHAAHWAGQGAPLARALPARELVATLLDELHDDDQDPVA